MKERAIAKLTNKKFGSRIICTNLIASNHNTIVYFTGFAPSQEARTFAQLLHKGESALEVQDAEGAVLFSSYNCKSHYNVILQKVGHNHHSIAVYPEDASFLVAQSHDECRDIFYRLLSQQHFVHREWYEDLFSCLEHIEPTLGNKICYKNEINIPAIVKEKIFEGVFVMPEPTMDLTLENSKDEDNEATITGKAA